MFVSPMCHIRAFGSTSAYAIHGKPYWLVGQSLLMETDALRSLMIKERLSEESGCSRYSIFDRVSHLLDAHDPETCADTLHPESIF